VEVWVGKELVVIIKYYNPCERFYISSLLQDARAKLAKK